MFTDAWYHNLICKLELQKIYWESITFSALINDFFISPIHATPHV